MTFRSRAIFLPLAASLALLTACGGGDGSDGKGAIAVSDTTLKAAIVWKAANQNIANDAARDKCGGGDCRVILQFSECGAISSDFDLGKYGVGEGNSEQAAQDKADEACRAAGGKNCKAPTDLPAKCN